MELLGTKHIQQGSYDDEVFWCGNCLKFIDPIYISLGDGEPKAACQECLLEEMIQLNITFGDADSPVSAAAVEDDDEVIVCQYPEDMTEMGLKTDTDDEPWYELGPSCMSVPAHQMRLLPSGDMTES